MQEETLLLDVDDVQFDLENPRIKMALEKYGDKMDAERIYFALRTATPDETSGGRGAGGFSQLRESIRAYGGLCQRIVVVKKSDKMVCIDGNTRLAIYKDFRKEDFPGEWSKIPATLMRDASQLDIEKIRTSAHLVGARQWPAYEKARYLHYLRHQKFMDYDEMIALCGGNKVEIERQIDAFNDMNDFYRDVVEDDEFKIDRFSGFVELQNPGVKAAIYEADLGMEDFGKWIKDGQISKLATVRQLRKVLRDEEAKKIFLNGGMDSISAAARHVDEKNRKSSSNENPSVDGAPITLLAQTLRRRLDDMPSADYRAWRNAKETPDEVQALEDLRETLEEILTDVREQ